MKNWGSGGERASLPVLHGKLQWQSSPGRQRWPDTQILWLLSILEAAPDPGYG